MWKTSRPIEIVAMGREDKAHWCCRKGNLALKVGLFATGIYIFLIVPERMQVLRPTHLDFNLGSAILF